MNFITTLENPLSDSPLFLGFPLFKHGDALRIEDEMCPVSKVSVFAIQKQIVSIYTFESPKDSSIIYQAVRWPCGSVYKISKHKL